MKADRRNQRTLTFLCFFGGIAAGLVPMPGRAANYFNYGAESDAFTLYGVPGAVAAYPYSTTQRSNATAHTGTYSVRMALDGIGGNEANGISGTESPDAVAYPFRAFDGLRIYYRWWMKIMPGFSWGTNEASKVKTNRILSSTPGLMRGYTGYMHHSGFSLNECDHDPAGNPLDGGCLNADGSIHTDGNVWVSKDMNQMADGQWHEYITMVKWNTCAGCMDAEFAVWIDGVKIGEQTGVRLGTVNDFIIEAWYGWHAKVSYWQMNSQTPAGGTIYFDDWSTDDVYHSLLPGPGATPPAAPRGLGVR